MQPEARVSVRLRTYLLPVLLGILLLLQLSDPNKGWVILLVGLGSAWLAGLAWIRALSKGLVLKREMRFGWAQVGDRLEERFTLANHSGLPGIWVEVRDGSNLPGYNASRVTGVGGESSNTWRSRGICTQRGAYTLGPTTLRSGDPFGFFELLIEYPALMPLIIMPPVVPLPAIQVSPGGRGGEGRRRAHALEETINASSVRPFQPGDSPRRIHWKQSARRDQLHVRLFDSTPSSDWWIFLDMDQQAQAGEGEGSTEEHSVILAASLADRGLDLNRSVGLVSGGQPTIWLPPANGTSRRWEILRALARLHPAQTTLAELLERARPLIRRRASLLVITPNASGTWLEALLGFVDRGYQPTVFLLDPESFLGPAKAASLMAEMARWGIAHYLIRRDFLDRPEARPGSAGRWEWRITPTGRAIPVHQPDGMEWKVLT